MKNRFHDTTGPTQRQLRVGELIRRALADLFARGDVYEPDLAGVSVTVGEVRCSPDLKVATVHVLPLGGKDAATVIAALNRIRVELRKQVTREVALKFSPDLRFVEDRTFDALDDARRLFDSPQVRKDTGRED